MELAAYFLPNIQFSSSSLCKLGPNPSLCGGVLTLLRHQCIDLWTLGRNARAHRGSTRLLLARETRRASARVIQEPENQIQYYQLSYVIITLINRNWSAQRTDLLIKLTNAM